MLVSSGDDGAIVANREIPALHATGFLDRSTTNAKLFIVCPLLCVQAQLLLSAPTNVENRRFMGWGRRKDTEIGKGR
jgi:hypothetical protein